MKNVVTKQQWFYFKLYVYGFCPFARYFVTWVLMHLSFDCVFPHARKSCITNISSFSGTYHHLDFTPNSEDNFFYMLKVPESHFFVPSTLTWRGLLHTFHLCGKAQSCWHRMKWDSGKGLWVTCKWQIPEKEWQICNVSWENSSF